MYLNISNCVVVISVAGLIFQVLWYHHVTYANKIITIVQTE